MLFMLSQTLTGGYAYAQSTTTNDDIIEPSTAPTSKFIDVTQINNILEENPPDIYVTSKETRYNRTALSPSIKTREGEHYEVWSDGWGVLIIFAEIFLIISLYCAFGQKQKKVGCLTYIAVNLIAIIALGGIFLQITGYKRHIIIIYFDNASDSKYEVLVNDEQFQIDEMSHVSKEISWTGFYESRTEVIEVRILSAAPKVEELERLKIRIKMDKSDHARPINKYVYNIGGANKYTIRTQTYR